jgi:hypothetical protein
MQEMLENTTYTIFDYRMHAIISRSLYIFRLVLMLKFICFETAAKNFLITLKVKIRLCQIFVAFSGNLNFTI